MTIMEKHDKAIIEAVGKLPDTFTWKMLSKKLNVLGYWISPKTVRRRLTNGVVNVERIDIGLYRKNKVYYYENGDVVGQKPKTLEAIAEKSKRPLTISEIENTEHYKALKARVEELEATIEENVDNSYRWNDKVKELKGENERLIKEKTELQESIKSMDGSVRERNAELLRENFDLKDKNELLQAVVDEFKKDLVNVGKLQWKLKDENETLQKDFVYYKNYHDGIQEYAKKYINETKKEAFFRLIKNRDIQLSFWTGWLINTILTLILSQVLK